LRLQPHLTLLRLNYPLDDFLISLRKDAGLRGEASNAMRERAGRSARASLLRSKRGAVCLAVHRYRNRVFYKRLEPAQFSLLSLFQPGRTLLSAFDEWSAFPEAASVTAEQIKKWFEHWSALGWFCRPTL